MNIYERKFISATELLIFAADIYNRDILRITVRIIEAFFSVGFSRKEWQKIMIGFTGYFISALFIAAAAVGICIEIFNLAACRQNARHAEIQKLLLDISGDFISTDEDSLFSKLNNTLQKLIDFYKLDRACIYISDLTEIIPMPVIVSPVHPSKNRSAENFSPSWISLLFSRNTESITFDDVQTIPDGSCELRKYLIKLGIKSLTVFAITEKYRQTGFICLESRQKGYSFRSEQIGILKIIANIISDASKTVRVENEIHRLSYYDKLTGLPNQRLFRERAALAINIAGIAKRFVGIMLIDLDSFKLINDSMGHVFGDQLLKEISAKLTRCLRKSDTVARYEGDEFIILLNSFDTIHEIKTAAETIMSAFNKQLLVSGQTEYITSSAGISVYPNDGNDTESLIKSADIAVTDSKKNGKNRYTFCTPKMKQEIKYSSTLTNDLYNALDRGELVLHYQPQLSIETGKITGFEALMRWEHPKLGTISPVIFIPLAEQNGLINQIGSWALETACRQAAEWQKKTGSRFIMAVNVSAVQMRNHNLFNQINDILRRTGLEPDSLELEITESTTMNEPDYIIQTLNTLKSMGIRLSIDDFGTEYSSLNRLVQLPVDRIKMDIKFVRGIEKSQKDKAIAKIIINLAKSLNLNLIAEGVENEKQLEFLKLNLCDEVQGFYYYKPMPAENAELLLRP